jgi:hypothetical protein
MDRLLRVTSLISGLVFSVLAAGLTVRAPWATSLWPFATLETRLGFLFLGSIAAAIAAPTIWIGLTGEVRAAAAGGINLTIIFLGMAVVLGATSIARGTPGLLVPAIVCAVATIGMVLLTGISHRFAWRDPRPMPSVIRSSFALFAAVLITVAGALLAGAPRIFPWPLARESSVMYGVIFLGAASYFIYGFLVPRWANTAGQLLGFLAYDLILIGPFVRHFTTVRPEHRVSLTIYVAVLAYSGLVAAYYLFVAPATRFGGTPEPASTA